MTDFGHLGAFEKLSLGHSGPFSTALWGQPNKDRAAKAGDGTRGSGRLSASGPLDLVFEAAEARTADRTFQLPCPRLGAHTANVTLSKDLVYEQAKCVVWNGGGWIRQV